MVKNHFFTFGNKGEVVEIGIGDTILDFANGTIKDYSGTVTKMSNNLRRLQIDFLRSLMIETNGAIKLQMDSDDKVLVKENNRFTITHQEFTRVILTATVATDVFLIVSTKAEALIETIVTDGEPDPFAYESKTVDATSGGVALTSGTYLDATWAELTLEEDARIRYRFDGTNPTASEGHAVDVGDTLTLKSALQISQFKAIRTADVSGILKITYFH